MADARLLALARQAAQGDPEAGGRLLREALRAGWLDPERLRALALIGDPAARLAQEESGPTPSLDAGLRRLDELAAGERLGARAGLAIARHLEPMWREEDPEAPGLLAALSAWCDCPCARHAEPLRALRRQLLGRAWALPAGSPSGPAYALRALLWAAGACDGVAGAQAASAAREGILALGPEGERGLRAAIAASWLERQG